MSPYGLRSIKVSRDYNHSVPTELAPIKLSETNDKPTYTQPFIVRSNPAPDYNRQCYSLQALFVLQRLYDSLTFKSVVKGHGMNHFLDWRKDVGAQVEKFYKTTLWQGEHVLVGLNCLEPNQTQSLHAHQGADKFYFVLEGSGQFTVGDEAQTASAGSLVVAPAGVSHGVKNTGNERLSLLVAIAPGIK